MPVWTLLTVPGHRRQSVPTTSPDDRSASSTSTNSTSLSTSTSSVQSVTMESNPPSSFTNSETTLPSSSTTSTSETSSGSSTTITRSDSSSSSSPSSTSSSPSTQTYSSSSTRTTPTGPLVDGPPPHTPFNTVTSLVVVTVSSSSIPSASEHSLISGPTGVLSPSTAHRVPFFQNTAAVAGVFVPVGIAFLALVALGYVAWTRMRQRPALGPVHLPLRERERRPLAEDDPEASGGGSSSTSDSDYFMGTSQRPLSPRNPSHSYAPWIDPLPRPSDDDGGEATPRPWVTDGPAAQAVASELPRYGRDEDRFNMSNASLPTVDYALEPTSFRFAGAGADDRSLHSSEQSVQDNVDYTRRVGIQHKRSKLRIDV